MSGSPAVQSSVKRSGSYALQCNPGVAAVTSLTWNIAATPTTLVYQVYLRVGSWPSAVTNIIQAAGAVGFSIRLDPADNKLYPRIGSVNGTPSAALSLDTWYRIDARAYCGSTSGSIEWQVDGSAQTTHTLTITATTFSQFLLGALQAVTANLYFDDLVISATTDDYPLGPIAVEGLSPSSDGTHSAGTNIMENQAGADIGAVSAYPLVNSVPIGDAAAYVRQAATGASNYAEVNYADTAHTVIKGAQALLAYQSSGTTANSGAAVVMGPGYATPRTIWGNPVVALADYSESSVFYKAAILGDPSGGWTKDAVNALYSRIGYSDNVTTLPYWIDLMLEVAYGPGPSPSASISPSTSISPSASASPSISPSVSPSRSPSASISPSASRSPSASASPSISPSASASPSIAPPIVGTTVWGHVTGVIETNVRTFTGNWSGSATISGAGDAEKASFDAGQNLISEIVETGSRTVLLLENTYAAGNLVTLYYRHGATPAACLSAAWVPYSTTFTSLGFVQVKLER